MAAFQFTLHHSLKANGLTQFRINLNYEEDCAKKVGYLANVKSSSMKDQNGVELSALLCYFIQDNGEWFKGLFPYKPYFYLLCAEEVVKEVMLYLTKTYEKTISEMAVVEKEDLELINHLAGKTSKFIKLSFQECSRFIECQI